VSSVEVIKDGDVGARSAIFWKPGSRRRFRGSYSVQADGGVEISVIGSLLSVDIVEPVPLIYCAIGEFVELPATCVNAVFLREDRANGSNVYWVETAYEGARLRDPERARFASLSIRMPSLEVFHERDFIASPAQLFADAVVSIPLVTERDEISLGASGRAVFVSMVRRSHSRDSISLRRQHFVVLYPARKFATYDRMWRELAAPLRDLIGLARMEPETIQTLTLMRGSNGSRIPDQIKVRAHRTSGSATTRHHLLFSTRDWDLGHGLTQWYSLRNGSSVAFNAFTESHTTNGGPAILFAASACEALHDRLFGVTVSHKSPYEAKIQRILNDIKLTRDKRFVERQLRAALGINLEARLKRLASELGARFVLTVIGVPVAEWATAVVDARNSIAHGDERAQWWLHDPRALSATTLTLQTLFTLVTMTRIGFSAEEAISRYVANPYRLQPAETFREVLPRIASNLQK
jgi:hypothetical protein